MVKKSGGLYFVEDNKGDVTVKVRVKRLAPIPAFLGELEEGRGGEGEGRGGEGEERRGEVEGLDALSFSFSLCRDDRSVQAFQEVESAETASELLQRLPHSRCVCVCVCVGWGGMIGEGVEPYGIEWVGWTGLRLRVM